MCVPGVSSDGRLEAVGNVRIPGPWQPVSEDKKKGNQKKKQGKTTHPLAEGISEAVLKLPKNKIKTFNLWKMITSSEGKKNSPGG